MKRLLFLLLIIFVTHFVIVFFAPLSIISIFDFLNIQSKVLNFNKVENKIDGDKHCILMPNKQKIILKGLSIPLIKGCQYRLDVDAKSKYPESDNVLLCFINGDYLCEIQITNSFWHNYKTDFISPKNLFTFGFRNPVLEIYSFCGSTNANEIAALSLSSTPLYTTIKNSISKLDSQFQTPKGNLIKNCNFDLEFLYWKGDFDNFSISSNKDGKYLLLSKKMDKYTSISQTFHSNSGDYIRVSAEVLTPKKFNGSFFVCFANGINDAVYIDCRPKNDSHTNSWRTIEKTVKNIKTGNKSLVIQYSGEPNSGIRNISCERVDK